MSEDKPKVNPDVKDKSQPIDPTQKVVSLKQIDEAIELTQQFIDNLNISAQKAQTVVITQSFLSESRQYLAKQMAKVAADELPKNIEATGGATLAATSTEAPGIQVSDVTD